MANNFCWDFGFDWNAVVTNNQAYLQNGFVNLSGGALPGTAVDLQPNDTVSFYLYNVTSGATPTSPYTVTGGTITFVAADQGQTQTTPFAETSISIGNIGMAQGSGSSSIFSGDDSSITFPNWGLAGPLAVVSQANPGDYMMTVTLNISNNGGTPVSFVVDPEMVVGAFG